MKPQPKVELDATGVRLQRLGLDHAASRLPEFVSDAVKREVPAHAFLDRILDAELAFRDERRIRTSLRISGLPTGQTIASFDFAFQPSVERSRIEAQDQPAGLRGWPPRVDPYLLSDVEIVRGNQVWSTDITFIPMAAGFCYLVATMDVRSRKILSWRLSNTPDARFCIDAFQEALERHGRPEILNTDQVGIPARTGH